MIFAVSDVVWQSIIAAICTIILGYFQYRAAQKVKEVKRDLDVHNEAVGGHMEEMARVGRSTHALVNSAMAAQLRLAAMKARALADVQPTKDNIRDAELAETLLVEHIRKQEVADKDCT